MSLDRARPPAPRPRPPVEPPAFVRQRLGHGLVLLAAPRPRLPLVRMDLLFPTAGGRHDPLNKAGLATLVSSLLDEAEPGRTATEAAERLGGSLFTGATWNTALANVTLLSKHLPRGLELLTRVGRPSHVTFPARHVARLQGQRLAALIQQRTDRRKLADQHLARALFGDTGYGRPLHGDFESIQGLDRKDLVRFHREHYRWRNAALVAVGDLDPSALLDRVAEIFPDDDAQPAHKTPAQDPPSTDNGLVVVVDDPEATHAELRLGQLLLPYGHADRVWMEMTQAILAASPTSRLPQRLRETEGWTYSIQIRMPGRTDPGPFEIATAVPFEHVGRAAAHVLEETERFLQDGPTDEEVDGARRHLESQFTIQLQAIEQWVNKLSLLPVFELPEDHFEHHLKCLRSARADKILTAARRHLQPKRWALAAVGPAQQLVPQLDSWGPVTVSPP